MPDFPVGDPRAAVSAPPVTPAPQQLQRQRSLADLLRRPAIPIRPDLPSPTAGVRG